jgi:LysR family cys regulon transcriptional activator
MNLRQLRYLKEVATNGFSISKAAKTLHTSQPGVSQQIIALERELGITVFVRDSKRLVGLTPHGEEIVARAHAALLEIEAIAKFARSIAMTHGGELVIATTHTQARYVLPEVLQQFAAKYPAVRVTLQHGSPAQIEQALISGAADFGVTPYVTGTARDIVAFECRRYRRIVLARHDHPLLSKRRCSLAQIAKHPLVTFEQSIAARDAVLGVFESAGLKPNVILSAIDADVVKVCVERGLGLAIVTEVSYDSNRDTRLGQLKTADLFPAGVTSVVIHRRHHLQPYALDFIEMFAPRWSRVRIDHVISTAAPAK